MTSSISRSKPQMRTFLITFHRPDSTGGFCRVEAAYFQTDGGFTTFKDDENQAVYSVRNDCLVSVERVEVCSNGDTSTR